MAITIHLKSQKIKYYIFLYILIPKVLSGPETGPIVPRVKICR
jgi:hypothetical protein